MPLPKRRKSFGTLFGLELGKCLQRRDLLRADLARRIEGQVSRQYIQLVATNQRRANPEIIEVISRTLQLGEHEQTRLYRAAALDAGFRIGGME